MKTIMADLTEYFFRERVILNVSVSYGKPIFRTIKSKKKKERAPRMDRCLSFVLVSKLHWSGIQVGFCGTLRTRSSLSLVAA